MTSRDLANLIDRFRTVPRLLMFTYMLMLWRVTEWYMAIPEPNTQHAALVTTVWGAGAAWFGLYVNGKRAVE